MFYFHNAYELQGAYAGLNAMNRMFSVNSEKRRAGTANFSI